MMEDDYVRITEFLLARISEDEAVAQEALSEEWAAGSWAPEVYDDGVRNRAVAIAPARVLAECEAKRRIVTLAWAYSEGEAPRTTNLAADTLRHLAAVYADHPDFDDAWRA